MGGSEALSMLFFIITTFLMMILLSSLQQSTHIIFTVDSLWNSYDVHDMYFIDESSIQQGNNINDGNSNKKNVEKISGLDENEEKQAMFVETFRTLLGLKSFHEKVPSSSSSSELLFSFSFSPSPSPSPTSIEPEAVAPFSPAPSPVVHNHHHHHRHHHYYHSHWNLKKEAHHHHEEDRGRAKKILVAILVSVGIATLICGCALIFFCRKFRNQRKKPKRTMPLCSSKKKNKNKVSLNSRLDLFYLDSLGEDLEQQQPQEEAEACTLKEISYQNNATEDCDNVSSSSTKEILPVHEEEEDIESESESGGREIGISADPEEEEEEEENHSSENESFHSIINSQTNSRLSNASSSSLVSETLMSPKDSSPLPNQFLSSPNNSISNPKPQPLTPKHENQETDETINQFVKPSTSPPPPPPPPPPPTPPLQMPLFRLHSLTSSSRASSPSPLSLKSHNFSSPSPRNSDSNQSPQTELPSPPPQPAKSPRNNNIPPPPCPPPPFPKSNVKTPPPPPSQLPQFTALGKDGAPLPKLKPLHWDKVRAAPNRTMVWDKLRSSSFELDEEMIESLFGYNLQSSIKNEETKSKSPSPSKHVLEPKRLQNITILSKAINATAENVCEALIQGKGLSLQQLEALVKMVPTKEEEAKLANYKGDINELGSAERFVRTMLQVPFAFQRVEGMLYKETFEDEVVHLRNSFSMLEEACKELRSSRLFSKLLETVLKTGNRMNVGTIRGGARAFKLDALLKLADVKGIDGKTTLLHFVVQEIIRSEGIRVSDSIMGKISQKNNKNRTEEQKEEDYRRMGLELVSGLSTELYNVKKTATIDLDVLASSVSNLSEEMAKLKQLVGKDLHNDGESSEGFVNTMKCFLSYAEKKLKELEGDENRVLSRVKEITEYFHGDVSNKEDQNPLRIFVIVRDFLGMLDSVCKELRRNKSTRSPNPLAPFR
ncbi:hypothetical protein S245_029696 [Arachis hypogaea]